ncbi:MAG: hypothetical protein KGM16_01625 [Bacteroidota bacterium]|nr:hypothetical protein [Bacteroidota bacterium]
MKLIKGNFSEKNKGAMLTQQKLEQQGHKTMLNEEVPYSAMLLDLLKPFMAETPHPDELEQILGLGIVGWNMAVSKATGFPDFEQMFDTTLNSIEVSKNDTTIVKDIMAAKQMKYPEHMNFIENYELIEDANGMMHVSVISKPFSHLMSNLEMEDEELEELQYEEGFVNRDALLVKPKPAFWNWFKLNDNDFEAPQFPMENTIYLIGEKDSDKETTNWLKKNFDKIFINELEYWITDEDYWPKKRNYKMFTDFFQLEYHSMVMDLEKEPVIKD